MLVHIATATVVGPWGPVHVAATAHGVVAVDWLEGATDATERWAHRFANRHADTAGNADDEAVRHLRVATEALDAFLAGRPPRTLPVFDMTDRPAWDQAVLHAVTGIRWGETASYGEIARRVGSPRAARAVGGAVGRNPVSLLIPCHRVIAADGTIGGYGGDAWGSRDGRLAIKRALLAREGVRLRDEDPDVPAVADGSSRRGWRGASGETVARTAGSGASGRPR